MNPPVEKSWVPLTLRERRVLGVLVEKAKTTPEYYPLTIAALVTGCNQKSNRDPVTNYDADDVEEILQGLRKKGAVVMVEAGGRVVRWKHTLYDWLKVTKVELAVIAELLLRGAQTEGDLRAEGQPDGAPARPRRRSRRSSKPWPPRIWSSTSRRPGVRRGVIVTHNLYPPQELEREKARLAARPDRRRRTRSTRPGAATRPESHAPEPRPTSWPRSGPSSRPSATRSAALADEVKELKSALGA